MRFEAGFVACYALTLLGVAVALHRLGRRDTSPWRSRLLAGHRRQTAEPPPPVDPADWPHSDAGRLHTLVAAVSAAAAVTLTTVEIARHHRAVEAAVLGGIGLLAVLSLTRLTVSLASHGRRHGHSPGGGSAPPGG